MNIFGLGWMELLIVLLLGFFVAGPKRMLHWAYMLGLYAGKLRAVWNLTLQAIREEFEEAGIEIPELKALPKNQQLRQILQARAKDSSNSLLEPLHILEKDVKTPKTETSHPAEYEETGS